MHFDLDNTVSVTRLTAATLNVKAKATRLIPARFGLRQTRKPLAHRRKRTGICGGVGPRRAANRALVNINDLIKMLKPFDGLTRARRLTGTVQLHRCVFKERLNR